MYLRSSCFPQFSFIFLKIYSIYSNIKNKYLQEKISDTVREHPLSEIFNNNQPFTAPTIPFAKLFWRTRNKIPVGSEQINTPSINTP